MHVVEVRPSASVVRAPVTMYHSSRSGYCDPLQRTLPSSAEFGAHGQVAGDHADLVGHHPAWPAVTSVVSARVVMHVHVPSISVSAAFSAVVTLSFQYAFTAIQRWA